MFNVSPARVAEGIARRIRVRTAATALLALVCSFVSSPSNAQNPSRPFNILPIRINSVTTVTNPATGITSLLAHGSLGSTLFTAPVRLSNAAVPTASTSILDLDLGRINLNLLGLDVATSPICLDITAVPGAGNLLGNLLYDISGLLNNGQSLSQVLSGLTSTQTTQLESGLTRLLNGALRHATSSAAFAGISATTPGACDILNLKIGPLDLNLLGLHLHLDNCHNGPVTVNITAISGPGDLLGNLLCDIAHLLDTHASYTSILAHLRLVAQAINVLI